MRGHAPRLTPAQVSLLFGFEEWDAPVVESEALFTRKAGEEITQQARFGSLSSARHRLTLLPSCTRSKTKAAAAWRCGPS